MAKQKEAADQAMAPAAGTDTALKADAPKEVAVSGLLIEAKHATPKVTEVKDAAGKLVAVKRGVVISALGQGFLAAMKWTPQQKVTLVDFEKAWKAFLNKPLGVNL